MLLLDRARRLYGEDLDITLAVPSEGVFYQASKGLGNVFALNEKTVILRSFSLWNKLRGLRPDVVLCNNEASFLTVLPAALALRLKMIWQIKNLRRSNWSDFLCFLFAARILAIARQAVKVKNPYLIRRFRRKIFIQPIGTRLEDFLELPAVSLEQDGVRLLALIVISRDKGADTLVEALEKLDARDMCARLRVAGITPSGCEQLERDLKERTASLKHIKVEWLGWHDDVLSLLDWCQVLVHPSRTDGVPRSMIEAMASGRPVIASRIGGIPESITDGQEGFLIPAGDADALADRIERLAGDADMRARMGRAGKARARAEFDIDRHIARLKEHLEAVAAGA